MKLYVKGILHWSPVSRSLLQKRYADIYSDEEVPPSFLAVEMGEDIFTTIILDQRRLFRIKIARDSTLRSLPEVLVDELACTIGHEGDAHKGIFPAEPPILWLDSFCDADSTRRQLAESLSNRYVHFLKTDVLPGNADMPASRDLRDRIHQALNRPSTKKCSRDFSRDAVWFDLIRMRLNAGRGYAIVVVGADHIQICEKYLCARLVEAGIEFASEDLTG
jgi:hypothetical protein